MMPKKYFWFVSLMLLPLVLAACQSSATPAPDAAQPAFSGIIAQGHIEPAFVQDAAFTVSGQVLEILVADGDTVTVGQTLARLSGAELRALELARAEQELLAAQKSLADLQANPDLVRAQADAAAAAAEKALDDARQQLDDLNNPDALLLAQLQARIQLLDEQLAAAQDSLQTLEDSSDPDALELAQATSAVRDLEKTRADAQQALADLQNPDALLVAQLQASLPLLEAQQRVAQDAAAALADGVDDDLLAAANARLKTAEAALASAQTNAASLELRAPASGTVVSLNLKPGQVVSAGVAVLTIADLSTWIVETDDLTEIEVVDITAGQSVSVILDAIPDATIQGVVADIARRFEDRRGDVTYTVTITLADVPANLRWGMIGQVKFAEGK